ncbi:MULTISPECIES: hypothetical protein [unclassified Virgibacillus]|uniref:hypothetical protein n=1 Tax=unclassified Virgibacillus TaxID=2620237 RepID=UPI00090B9E51|nr:MULTISPECIES: hypothetical protein [unclassified Virgibacillus]API93496.1 hypothetical protein BKP57_17785 [Virgibacillus sp. 6R]MBS7430118.1 hypothetical protein [Virgibacillus sp. 19R1-5]
MNNADDLRTVKVEKSQELRDLIAKYQQQREQTEERQKQAKEQADKIQAELSQAQRKLEQAMDATLADPSNKNQEKERELRRKIADLQLDLQGAQGRKDRAFRSGSSDANTTARQAVNLAKQEAQDAVAQHFDAVKKRIEDAKYEYLKALVGYRQFELDIERGIFFDTVEAVNQSNTKVQRPYVPSVQFLAPPSYYTNYHGVVETEVSRAYKHGKITRGSVRPEREIN